MRIFNLFFPNFDEIMNLFMRLLWQQAPFLKRIEYHRLAIFECLARENLHNKGLMLENLKRLECHRSQSRLQDDNPEEHDAVEKIILN
mmetsp:Transcript_19208/g.27029  ORF Transcript_19208/g.27029 Transcript_19208/m.27029 type:complete len:88 (+) Transcript_19208:370-633(+)